MKRAWFILIGGLFLGLVAFSASYMAASRSLCCAPSTEKPELAWLKEEFKISDSEFARVSKLHDAYQTACAERCERIDAKNAELQKLLASTETITPEIEAVLREAALLRAECHKAMLQHFFEVSRTMPPDQAKRYLSWVIPRTLGPAHASMTSDSQEAMSPDSHAPTHESGHE